MDITSLITLELIGTFYGATVVVTAVTQIVKKYINTNPKWVALTLAVIISLINVIAIGEHTVVAYALSLFNALVIAGASIGAFETVKSVGRHIHNKKEEKADGEYKGEDDD